MDLNGAKERLIIIPLDMDKPETMAIAVQLAAPHLPDGLDSLINNAGVSLCKHHPDIEGFDPDLFYKELWTNTVAPNLVTQAFLPLLRKGKTKKVAFMTTILGSITLAEQFNISSTLSASKAALNMTIKKWAAQLANEGFIFIPVHPGWVKTDMGGPDAMIDVEPSIHGVLEQIDAAKPETSGVFVGYDGQVLPW